MYMYLVIFVWKLFFLHSTAPIVTLFICVHLYNRLRLFYFAVTDNGGVTDEIDVLQHARLPLLTDTKCAANQLISSHTQQTFTAGNHICAGFEDESSSACSVRATC